MSNNEKTFRVKLMTAWIKGWKDTTTTPYPAVAMDKASELITSALQDLAIAPQSVDLVQDSFYKLGINHAKQWSDGGIWI